MSTLKTLRHLTALPAVALLLAANYPVSPTASSLSPRALLHSSGIPATPPALPAFSFARIQASTTPNHAQADGSWWRRADPHFTLNASLLAAHTAHPLIALQPGTKVLLNAQWTPTPHGHFSGIRWRVNSRQATVGSVPWTAFKNHPLMLNGAGVFGLSSTFSNPAQFQAHAPGVYTIQAFWHGSWSVPLVLTVGLSSLSTGPWPVVPPAAMGVVAASASRLAQDPHMHLLSAQKGRARQAVIHVGSLVDGWMPVYGTIPPSAFLPQAAHTLTVNISNYSPATHTSHFWSYDLPLNATGQFADWMRDPWHNPHPTSVAFTINQDAVFTAKTLPLDQRTWPRTGNTVAYTDVAFGSSDNPSPSVPPNVLEHLATGLMNLNTRAIVPYVHLAQALLHNAPSLDTGLAAVANYVSERVAYNHAEWTAQMIPLTTASQTLQTGLGVGDNYATALATLYRALGIPARIVTGVTRPSIHTPWTTLTVPKNGEDWVQVQGTHGWISIDPTWNTRGTLPLQFITNAYTTNTTFLLDSHHAVALDHVLNN